MGKQVNKCSGQWQSPGGAAPRFVSALTLSALALWGTLISGAAQGAQQPAYLTGGHAARGRPPHGAGGLRDGITFFDGRPARQWRLTSSRPGARGRAAWRAFQRHMPGQWLAQFDEVTGVPTRIFGSGVPAPNSQHSGQAAARFARVMLKKHLSLLAPGGDPQQFQLVSNLVSGGQRVVAFRQHHRGMRVLGGQVSFRFRNDRLYVLASDAKPFVSASPVNHPIHNDVAKTKAQAWLLNDGASAAHATAVGAPLVLPLIGPNQAYGYRTVVPVTVETKPLARYQVYLDAANGQPVAREQTLRFAEGTVLFNAPVRYPGDVRINYPARFATVTINGGATVTTTEAGVLSFAGSSAITAGLTPAGSLVTMTNEAGAVATQSLPLAPGDSVIWNEQADPAKDAQLTAFVHTYFAKQHGKSMGATFSWLDANLPVRVNHNDVCNAFYDGEAINFFRQDSSCENTGRLADVVYHEFGHGFHHHSVIEGSGDFEPALSEGVSDYYAASLTGDPAMGRGFFYSAAPLRHIDPSDGEAIWPQDISPDPHETGLIIGGALWDLRKLLVAKHGEVEGAALTNALFFQALRNASDIPSMYPEVLAADDDDGNLENGTPNVCEIIAAFGAHGLRSIDATAGALSIEPPDNSGYDVALQVKGLFAQCAGDGVSDVRLSWRLRRLPNHIEQLVMAGGPSDYLATIPKQQPGEVVQYDVRVSLNDGSLLSFPDNLADPRYEFFVGKVIPLYCTDFESDPTVDGWTHGLLSGSPDEGADDWQWDVPLGTATNGDPPAAFSGMFVYGNDLGHDNFNGLYQPDKTNYSDSPIVDVGDYTNVRVQYRRWLNVEDGFFDQARILANGAEVWSNYASLSDSNAQTHHRDSEWRFQDVDVSQHIGADKTVQIRFELASDQGLQFGGWSLDDFCIVAYEDESPIEPECGNGAVEPGEQCDDGNLENGDGCDNSCANEEISPGDNTDPALLIEQGCGCRSAATPLRSGGGWLLLGLALGLFRRRQRRRRK